MLLSHLRYLSQSTFSEFFSENCQVGSKFYKERSKLLPFLAILSHCRHVQFALGLVGRAVANHRTSSEAMGYIKELFEGEYGGEWGVIVGKSFSTSATDDYEDCIHAQVGDCDIIIFPTS